MFPQFPRDVREQMHRNGQRLLDEQRRILDWQTSQADLVQKHVQKQLTASWDLAMASMKAASELAVGMNQSALEVMAPEQTEG